jgi:hypothetical protein
MISLREVEDQSADNQTKIRAAKDQPAGYEIIRRESKSLWKGKSQRIKSPACSLWNDQSETTGKPTYGSVE